MYNSVIVMPGLKMVVLLKRKYQDKSFILVLSECIYFEIISFIERSQKRSTKRGLLTARVLRGGVAEPRRSQSLVNRGKLKLIKAEAYAHLRN